MQQVGTESLWI